MQNISKIILSAVIAGGLIFFGWHVGGGDEPQAETAQQAMGEADNTADNADAMVDVSEIIAAPPSDALEAANPLGEITLGVDDAPIVIVEYSSLTCPHCAAFHAQGLPALKRNYIDKGLVQMKFRPMPFDTLATTGAMLAQCIVPERRLILLDTLFLRQSQWSRSDDPALEFEKIARQVGMTGEEFRACLKNHDVLDGIRAMQKAAYDELDVRSTPTFFVNGQKLEGNVPLSEFEKLMRPFLPAEE